MSTKNERSLALIARDLLVKSDLKIAPETLSLYLETIKDILSESEDGVRRPRTDDSCRYEGVECRDYAKVEKIYAKGEDGAGSDDDQAVCNAKRLGLFGEVVMLTAWKKDDQGDEKCALCIFYDYTLHHVLQPVTNETGKLLGFTRVDTDELCGQSRLRNNLRTWSEKGQQWWEETHHFETDRDYLVVSPRYQYHNEELWQKLCDRFYKVYPRIKASEIDNAGSKIEAAE